MMAKKGAVGLSEMKTLILVLFFLAVMLMIFMYAKDPIIGIIENMFDRF